MKASTQRLIIILGSFGLMITSIYTFFSLILPSYEEIQNLRAERQNRIELYNTQAEAGQKIGSLIDQYESLSEVQKGLSAMLPTGPQSSLLMNQIQGIAGTNNLILKGLSFQYQPLKQSESLIVKPVGTVRLGLSLEGVYEDFEKFIDELETNIRVIDVVTLEVEGGAVSRQDVLLYNIFVDAYYQE